MTTSQNVRARSDLDLLLEHFPSEELEAHVRHVCELDGRPGVPWAIGIDLDFLGFLTDYWHYAQVFATGLYDAETVIVDVGCSVGWQHVFFKDCLAYIGIDYSTAACRAFTANAQFWEGAWGSPEIQTRLDAELTRLGKVARKLPARFGPLHLPELRLVGIANMSLLYGGTARDLELMHQRFRQLVLR